MQLSFGKVRRYMFLHIGRCKFCNFRTLSQIYFFGIKNKWRSPVGNVKFFLGLRNLIHLIGRVVNCSFENLFIEYWENNRVDNFNLCFFCWWRWKSIFTNSEFFFSLKSGQNTKVLLLQEVKDSQPKNIRKIKYFTSLRFIWFPN